MPTSWKHREQQKLSVLMPLYNEKYTVEQVVEAVLASRLPQGVEREIIIVDDASTDGSSALADRLAEQHSDITVLHQTTNQGKGAAIRRAIRRASGTVGIIQDADLEYDPHEYSRLIEPILNGEADAVFGSRFVAAGRRRVLYFWHSLGNRMLTAFSNMLTDLNLTDMGTCYKAVRMSIMKSIPIRSARFGIEPELTAKLAKRGCRIFEVPISYRGRTYREGKKITWKDGLRAVATIMHYWLVDDLYDEANDKAILLSLSNTHRFNGWMADAIRPFVGENVLEIGAGLGNLTDQFLPRESYTATDIDRDYLDFLASKYAENQRIRVDHLNVVDTAECIKHRGRYDTVICCNVIEHIRDDHEALKNIWETLKPGGTACLLVPRGPTAYGTLDKALGHQRRYTERQWKERIEAAGFVCDHLMQFNRIGLPAWWLNGRVLKRDYFSKWQLKLFDSSICWLRYIDRFMPWPGVSLLAIASKRKHAADI